MRSSPRWPAYATYVVPHPIYKLESRRLYVDVPHVFLFMFVDELLRLPSKLGIDIRSPSIEDIAKLYNESITISEKVNREIKRSGIDWLKVGVVWRRSVPQDKKPLRIRYWVNWSRFHKFLEDYAASDIPLPDKYEDYIYYCRENLIRMLARGYDLEKFGDFINQVKEVASADIKAIGDKVYELMAFLKQFQRKLYRKLQYLKRKYRSDIRVHVIFYLQEFISFLETIKFLSNNGLITSCYREMRRLLETLCWAIFDDLLCLRIITQLNVPVEMLYDVDVQYRIIRRSWYNWAKSNKATLNTHGEVVKAINEFEGLISRYFPDDIKKMIGVKDLVNLLIKNMVYHLFGLIFGKEATKLKRREGIYPVDLDQRFINIVKQNVSYVLRKIARINVPDLDQVISSFIRSILINKPKRIVMPFLSNSAMIYLVEKMTSVKGLATKYEEYSYFVHTYTATWQGIPFSSILEIKILKNELQKLEDILKELLSQYYNLAFKISR